MINFSLFYFANLKLSNKYKRITKNEKILRKFLRKNLISPPKDVVNGLIELLKKKKK